MHPSIHREWPGNSPDLNPIENLGTIKKDKVAYKQLSSAENLRQAIKEVWVTMKSARSTGNLWYTACRVTTMQSLTAKKDILNTEK